MMGLPSLARSERARAHLDREDAASEVEYAQLPATALRSRNKAQASIARRNRRARAPARARELTQLRFRRRSLAEDDEAMQDV